MKFLGHIQDLVGKFPSPLRLVISYKDQQVMPVSLVPEVELTSGEFWYLYHVILDQHLRGEKKW